ncbi:hypothetical protein [Streptomyces beihaiensis]|uniref:Uncharacterized protein n=1 Tax=Streptomyces beihaiensis TaxID=2984495 RepID=A0ABT3U2R3_9ACTN|nr:hypothetical protein [Streptomyces beihaiensis]MCX3063569.1 hypothetical protein [Streptomyces beihaiensis]
MSKEISVSDEYVWTTSTGMYLWIIEYLRSRVPDRELWDFVEEEGDLVVGNFFVSDLPEPYRHRVLRILADDVPQAYADELRRRPEQSSWHGHVVRTLEILAMMSAEFLRELGESGRPGGGESL